MEYYQGTAHRYCVSYHLLRTLNRSRDSIRCNLSEDWVLRCIRAHVRYVLSQTVEGHTFDWACDCRMLLRAVKSYCVYIYVHISLLQGCASAQTIRQGKESCATTDVQMLETFAFGSRQAVIGRVQIPKYDETPFRTFGSNPIAIILPLSLPNWQ